MSSDQEAGLQELREEIEALRDRVDDLEDRLDEGSSSLPPSARDHRDAQVLDALDPGQVVWLSALQRLYHDRTEIRDDEILRQRVETLTDSEASDQAGLNRWRYHGNED